MPTAGPLLGRFPVSLDVEGYTTGESARQAVADARLASVQGIAVDQIAIAGEADAVVSVRVYDAAADGVRRMVAEIALDGDGFGALGLAVTAFAAGAWVTLESDTAGDYTIIVQVLPPVVGV